MVVSGKLSDGDSLKSRARNETAVVLGTKPLVTLAFCPPSRVSAQKEAACANTRTFLTSAHYYVFWPHQAC